MLLFEKNVFTYCLCHNHWQSIGSDSSATHLYRCVTVKRRVIPSHLCTPVDCQQFGKRSENVKEKSCLKVIIAIFPSLTIVLSFRDVAKTAFWVNWNRGTWPPVATALHHFPAYATDLSADLDVWKDENEIWRPLRLRMAYSSGFQPAGHRGILWWARAIWVIVNSVKKLS